MRRLERLERGPTYFEWPAELAALLGEVSDRDLARKAGVSWHTVAAERHRRGIGPAAPRRPAVEWTAEMEALLGTDSDRAVAEELGLHMSSVRYRREVLGIPAYGADSMPRRRASVWSPAVIAILGTMPDAEVARQLGLNAGTVARKRKVLRVPPWQEPARHVDWTPEGLALLGTKPDREVAALLGVSVNTVKSKRAELGVSPFGPTTKPVAGGLALEALLRLPNREATRRGGISVRTLGRLRRTRGVPAPRPESRWWTPEVVARLGKEADCRIAAALGVNAETVADKRRKLGIPAYRRVRKPGEEQGVSKGTLRSEGRGRGARPAPWTEEEVALLGSAPDREVAEHLGRSPDAVRLKRVKLGIPFFRAVLPGWGEEEVALLGTAPDRQVAQHLGRTLWGVKWKRQRLGIRSFRAWRAMWSEVELGLLGTAPDSEVAQRLGRAVETVRAKRHELGIPCLRLQRLRGART